ncbi:MAG: rhomboid family intramembrane serine protease [Bacteroidetes bacterium]|nr:rhomboid family intramembrane serine protease [Bacteroidota bacterium]
MGETTFRSGYGKKIIGEGNPLVLLIALNLILFVVLQFIQIVYVLDNHLDSNFDTEVRRYFVWPADFKALLQRPWVLLTGLFTHTGVWQLIGNMLFLWGFGFILQDLSGQRHTTPLYLYGGWIGGILYLFSVSLIPAFAGQLNQVIFSGAGASIMAIAAAATRLSPQYRIFPLVGGGIPLWVITLIYLLIDFAGLAGAGFPHHLAHLAGATVGLLYISLLQKGYQPGQWMHTLSHRVMHWFGPGGKTNKGSRQQLFYQTNGRPPFEKKNRITQQKIDALLDKINLHGISSLTEEEKKFLKKAGEEK